MAYYSKKKGEGLRIVLCARTNRVLQGNAFCSMISCVYEVKLIQCSIFVYLNDKKPLTWGWHYLLVRLTAASIRCLFPDDLRTRVWQICGRKAHEGQNFSFWHEGVLHNSLLSQTPKELFTIVNASWYISTESTSLFSMLHQPSACSGLFSIFN